MTTCYIGFFQRVELGKGPRCSAEYYKGPGRLYSGDSDQGRKKPKSHSSYILSVFLPSRKSRSLEKWGIKKLLKLVGPVVSSPGYVIPGACVPISSEEKK